MGESNAAAKAVNTEPQLAAVLKKVLEKKAAAAIEESKRKAKDEALLEVHDLMELMIKLGYLTRAK